MSDSLARIRRAVLRADKIVKDLLAFSRMETDQFDPQPLDEILDEALALVGGQTELKRIEVIRQYAPNPPPVRIDRNQILQVFINLLLNAVEAMPEGGVLRLGLFQGRGLAGHPYLEITVEDTGPGIPDPLRGKIFDPFFTTKKHSGNTGLGLFVARGIVEKYKGQITVFSREGEGANITILLPCREEDLPKPQGR